MCENAFRSMPEFSAHLDLPTDLTITVPGSGAAFHLLGPWVTPFAQEYNLNSCLDPTNSAFLVPYSGYYRINCQLCIQINDDITYTPGMSMSTIPNIMIYQDGIADGINIFNHPLGTLPAGYYPFNFEYDVKLPGPSVVLAAPTQISIVLYVPHTSPTSITMLAADNTFDTLNHTYSTFSISRIG